MDEPLPTPRTVPDIAAGCDESRRGALLGIVGAAAVATALTVSSRASATSIAARAAPGAAATEGWNPSAIPPIGLGTWITFNVGHDPRAVERRVEVMRRFFAHGGGLVDSSPMYGSAEAVLGRCLKALQSPAGLIAATKVWTSGDAEGRAQMAESLALWGLARFDLMQVHNLLDWRTHLDTLKSMRAESRVGAVGITTSHGRRHDDFERIMAKEPIDCVQLSYNAGNRAVESRLLPLALERGIAVIVNRPFARGALIQRLEREPLPGWAGEIGCTNWPQVLLKLVVSHPAVTCAIPATSNPEHLDENMAAGTGPMPDQPLRARMFADIEALL